LQEARVAQEQRQMYNTGQPEGLPASGTRFSLEIALLVWFSPHLSILFLRVKYRNELN
jgi:hypothetical protein